MIAICVIQPYGYHSLAAVLATGKRFRILTSLQFFDGLDTKDPDVETLT